MYRKFRIAFAAGYFVVLAAPVLADVNCEQVRRYAKTGRSEEEIAETMIIDIDTVKKCLQGAGATAPGAPTPAAAPAK